MVLGVVLKGKWNVLDVEQLEVADEHNDEDVSEVLRDVRAFLDDPVALLERAIAVLKAQRDRLN